MANIQVPFDDKGASLALTIKADQYADTFIGVQAVVGTGTASVNMTGYAFTGSVRKSPKFSDTIGYIGFDTSSASSGIVTYVIPSGVTTSVNQNSPRYYYEVDITDSEGYTRRFSDGNFNVDVGVSTVGLGSTTLSVSKIIEPVKIKEDIIVPKGVDYQHTFNIINKKTNGGLDFSGLSTYVLSSSMKEYDSDTELSATFIASFSSLSTGVVKISLTDTITSSLTQGRYFYDVLIAVGNTVNQQKVRLAQGSLIVV